MDEILEKLKQKFAHNDGIEFYCENTLPCVRISNKFATAKISLYGAHILSYVPAGDAEVLFMSTSAQFVPGKAIRGGIPVCWPWFGKNTDCADLPAHGFARVSFWRVAEFYALDNGSSELILELTDNDVTVANPVGKFYCRMRFVVGPELIAALEANNLTDFAVKYSGALHSYFRVGNVKNIGISGLTGSKYFDSTRGEWAQEEREQIRITGEVDSIYSSDRNCFLEDRDLGRVVKVAKFGSRSTVIWNPGSAKAGKMADLSSFDNFVCIESANALNDFRMVKPGQRHTLQTIISVEKCSK